MEYHSPFHESTVHSPFLHPFQDVHNVFFPQNNTFPENYYHPQQAQYDYHPPTHAEAYWQHENAYLEPAEEVFCMKKWQELVHPTHMQQQEPNFQVHDQQQEVLVSQEQRHQELEEQRKYYEELLETQKKHMQIEAKKQFDARWK